MLRPTFAGSCLRLVCVFLVFARHLPCAALLFSQHHASFESYRDVADVHGAMFHEPLPIVLTQEHKAKVQGAVYPHLPPASEQDADYVTDDPDFNDVPLWMRHLIWNVSGKLDEMRVVLHKAIGLANETENSRLKVLVELRAARDAAEVERQSLDRGLQVMASAEAHHGLLSNASKNAQNALDTMNLSYWQAREEYMRANERERVKNSALHALNESESDARSVLHRSVSDFNATIADASRAADEGLRAASDALLDVERVIASSVPTEGPGAPPTADDVKAGGRASTPEPLATTNPPTRGSSTQHGRGPILAHIETSMATPLPTTVSAAPTPAPTPPNTTPLVTSVNATAAPVPLVPTSNNTMTTLAPTVGSSSTTALFSPQNTTATVAQTTPGMERELTQQLLAELVQITNASVVVRDASKALASFPTQLEGRSREVSQHRMELQNARWALEAVSADRLLQLEAMAATRAEVEWLRNLTNNTAHAAADLRRLLRRSSVELNASLSQVKERRAAFAKANRTVFSLVTQLDDANAAVRDAHDLVEAATEEGANEVAVALGHLRSRFIPTPPCPAEQSASPPSSHPLALPLLVLGAAVLGHCHF